jgi:hypothetical protein
LSYAKTGFDLLRSAIGLAKDVQGALPAGEKKDAVGASLAEAERRLRTAEGEIAQGLGYKLCCCEFPPYPMLQMGYYFGGLTRRVDVHDARSLRPPTREAWLGIAPFEKGLGPKYRL